MTVSRTRRLHDAHDMMDDNDPADEEPFDILNAEVDLTEITEPSVDEAFAEFEALVDESTSPFMLVPRALGHRLIVAYLLQGS